MCFLDFPHLRIAVNLLHFVSRNKSLSENNLDGQAREEKEKLIPREVEKIKGELRFEGRYVKANQK